MMVVWLACSLIVTLTTNCTAYSDMSAIAP